MEGARGESRDGMMRLLLLSNSVGGDGVYLEWARPHLRSFLKERVSEVVFVPYAGVPDSESANEAYAARVRLVFESLGFALRSVHESEQPVSLVGAAQAIVVGGGNTFHLLSRCYSKGLLDAIGARVRAGAPFIGWSAGANLACPGIWTTNDMPIVEPPSLRALGLVTWQVNPHFTDALPGGHRGETRSQRIAEFLAANPDMRVIGLREGAGLRIEDGTLHVFGAGACLFRFGIAATELGERVDLSTLS
jgi:dipeptidase E